MDRGQIADGEFVEPGGDRSMLFELVDAALDGVAVTIALGIERWWAATGAATVAAVAGLIGGDRDRGLDPSSPQPVPVGSTGICLVGQHPIRACSRSATTSSGDLDTVQNRHELRTVTSLTSSDQHRQYSTALVTRQM